MVTGAQPTLTKCCLLEQQIAVLEVHVERDLAALSRQIRQLVPGSAVRVEAVSDNVVLTGSTRTPSDAVNAASIAARFIGDSERVLNMIATEDSEQVHLKVTVAEVRRNVLKQLGINLRAVINSGTQLAIITENPFALGSTISSTAAAIGLGNSPSSLFSDQASWTGDRLAGTLRAMEQNGLMRVLAEPTPQNPMPLAITPSRPSMVSTTESALTRVRPSPRSSKVMVSRETPSGKPS
jgi:pilus assembly protein CpaC